MSFIKKILCVSLCVCLFTAIVGCAPSRPIEGTEDELRVVGTVGDFEVLFEEFRFVALMYKEMLKDNYGDDIFNSPESAQKYAEMIREYTYDNITYNYAILTMCREVGIEADDPILQAAVEDSIADTVKSVGGTRGKYKKYLKENYMTDHFLRFNTCIDLMQNELFYVYTDDLGLIETDEEKLFDIINDEFIRTQHIYISKSNGKSESENRQSIEAALKALNEGQDFLSVSNAFGEDEEITSDGIYFVKGYMNESYESAAFSLNINEYGDIVEDDNGFYIIKRLKPDTAYIFKNFSNLANTYQQYKFIEMIDDVQQKLEFIPNEYILEIDILEIE